MSWIKLDLAGRAERIKAYSIATEVFRRDQSFDAQNDPVVRIEAGRLRRALERYYLVAGRDDPLLIDLPKGSYVPTFTRRAVAAAVALDIIEPAPGAALDGPASRRWRRHRLALAALVSALCVVAVLYVVLRQSYESPATTIGRKATNEPTLVVVPFSDLGSAPEAGLYAAGLTEEILAQLARFRELAVLGRETSRIIRPQTNPARLHQELAVRYVLEGAVRVSGDRVRVTARLLDAEKGTVLWSSTYDENLRLRDLLAIQEDVAHQVAAALAQPYGIIFRADMQRTAQLPPDDLEAYACSLRFYVYRADLSADQHASIRGCLEKAVIRYPDYATAWGMLAYLYLDEDRFEFNRKSTAPLPMERALTAARRAVRLDPDNVRAQQALMTVLFFNQEPVEALRFGEQALALNPNDTELLGELGSRLMMAGDRRRGMALLEQALDRNPGHSGYYRGILALGAYLQRDYERAVIEIRRADLQKFSIYHVVAAIIFAQRGMMTEAREAGAQFLRMRPKFFDNLDAELAKRNFGPEDRAHLIEGLRKADLPVAER